MLPHGGMAAWQARKRALIRKYGYDPIGLQLLPRAISQPLLPYVHQSPAVIQAHLTLLLADTSGQYDADPLHLHNLARHWEADGQASAARALRAAAAQLLPSHQTLFSTSTRHQPPPTANAYGQAVEPDRGLVLHLDMERSSEAVLQRHGTHPVPGIVGKAHAFNGQGDRWELRVPELDGFTGSFSISLWVRPEALRRFDRLMGKARNGSHLPGWQFGFGPLPDLQWGLSTHNDGWKDFWINAPVPVQQWSHLAAVVDHSLGEVRYYLNGKWVGSARDLLPFPASETPLLLGCNAGGQAFFQGSLDELRLYRRALSEAEVVALYERDAR